MNKLSDSVKMKMQNKYSSKGKKNCYDNKNQTQNFNIG